MNNVTITITKEELGLLIRRYESSLEKDANREVNIDEKEFALLRKLTLIK